jgi:ABC-2 type transport system ATP-binding protein
VLGVLGAPGAGKTTLVKLIAGLIHPTAGQVRVLGYDLRRERDAARPQIGVLLGRSRTVTGRRSVAELLLQTASTPATQQGLAGRVPAARGERLLHELNLWACRDDPVGMLPRGMQRRVALARVLLPDPPILLLDEPTWNLAAPEAGEVIAAVRAMRAPDRTIILATSHLALACDLCDRVAILDRGRLVREQAVLEILDLLRQERYQIRVKGHLDQRWAEWFDGMAISHTTQGDTLLTGVIADQAALHGLLARVRDLNLPLLAVQRIDPDVDEVLGYLVGG